MKRARLTYAALGIPALMFFCPPGETLAATFTAQDLADLTQSTATDTDAVLLYLLGGNNPAAQVVPSTTFTYSGSGDAASWSGTLSGTLVNSFTLTYASTVNTSLSNSWTSGGTLSGVGPVTGGGSVSVSYPTGTTFSIDFSDTLSAGGNTYSITSLIPGTFNADGSVVFGPPGEVVSTNMLAYSGSGSPSYVGFFKWSYYRSDPNRVSDIWGIPIWPGGPWDNYYKRTPGSGGAYVLAGTIVTSVPEPSSLVLLATGLLIVAARRRRGSRAE